MQQPILEMEPLTLMGFQLAAAAAVPFWIHNANIHADKVNATEFTPLINDTGFKSPKFTLQL